MSCPTRSGSSSWRKWPQFGRAVSSASGWARWRRCHGFGDVGEDAVVFAVDEADGGFVAGELAGDFGEAAECRGRSLL